MTSNPVHSYSVRICHWINVIACAYLLVSGVHILLDFPELYWGHTGYRGYPAIFKLSDWGLSWDEAGKLGDRRWGRNYHVTFAWVFLINGLVYVGWNLYTSHFREQMVPGSYGAHEGATCGRTCATICAGDHAGMRPAAPMARCRRHRTCSSFLCSCRS